MGSIVFIILILIIFLFRGTEAMSGWSQPLMSSHMMHPQLQAEQSAFSQHQPMEQDDTGIANPANNYHQPQHLPNSYMDFPKVRQSYGCLRR